MDELHEVLDKTDKRVYQLIEKQRRGARIRYNRNITPASLQYQVGEFVKVSMHKVSRRKRDKTRLVWLGPYLIDEIVGDDLYRLKDPLGNTLEAHSARLKWYDGKGYRPAEEVRDVFLKNYGQFEVKQLMGVEMRDGEYCAKVWWRGFEEEEATFVQVRQLMEDVPDLMVEHIIAHREDD